eukprot:scaffold517_cov255-Pinguiococcus_pyrenoidosus.AAC.12
MPAEQTTERRKQLSSRGEKRAVHPASSASSTRKLRCIPLATGTPNGEVTNQVRKKRGFMHASESSQKKSDPDWIVPRLPSASAFCAALLS